MKIGNFQQQTQGYKAFIPASFPPKAGFNFSDKINKKATIASLRLGKLDGITQLLPDADFFIFMYITKDATSSSQIEGTRATMMDAIEAESNISDKLPGDVDDILHYIDALNYGLERLKDFPLSLRVIKEIHQLLMSGARQTHFSDPGNFRSTQNWIGGTSPANASFVPPPAFELNRALGDLENFFHKNDHILPIIKAGLIHGQFETIHPFLDGNGRTGRMLITLFLWMDNLLEKPVLFLSSYFNKHRQTYYEKLNAYHHSDVESWIDFFLDGVIETADEAIEIAKKITVLREEDMKKIQSLGKIESASAIKILPQLFKSPIVNTARISEWTGYGRAGAGKVINRFIGLGILEPKDENKKYGRSFIYRRYVNIFNN
jgi:Fic family protein